MDQLANISYIVEAITDSFLFEDLLNCVLVSRAWHDVLSPILYLDVVTFRSTKSDLGCNYIPYFNTPATRLPLHKHSDHIRAITCHGPDILAELSGAKACGLREINYVADLDSPLGTQLDRLALLVASSPDLRAVSMELVHPNSEEDLEALTAFVRFLDDYPSMTCFFLEIDPRTMLDVDEVMLEILEKRLDLVQAGSVDCLDLAPNPARSNRGPPWRKGQRCWPAREQPFEVWYSRKLEDQVSHGRWDNQIEWKPWVPTTMAVLEKGDGLLQVWFWDLSSTTLYRRFSQLRQIRGKMHQKPDDRSLSWLMGIQKRDHDDQFYLSALKDLIHLREIDLCYDKYTEEQVDRLLLDRVLDLSAVHVEVRNTTFPEYLLRHRGDYGIGQQIRGLMVSLVFQDTLKMSDLLHIFDLCYNLEVLDAKKVLIDGSGPPLLDTSLPWVSEKLRKLRLGFWLYGHPNDTKHFDGYNEVPEDIKTRSLESARKIAPSFMEQLGYQTDLRHLELSFNAAYRCGTSPFLQLAVGPVNGLDQLSKLSHLEYFSVTGLFHEVGSTEIEWMARHWPRLEKIQLPLFDAMDKTELTTSHYFGYEKLVPYYGRWFPSSLSVVKIGAKHYHCLRCRDFPDKCHILRRCMY
ncbi:MAG: hypothetical protein BYD32DRAFT_434048 [Podila humilis]|nr:MAG: hypothetical protein BYD32DRAFT_434048 [Podila humilis]